MVLHGASVWPPTSIGHGQIVGLSAHKEISPRLKTDTFVDKKTVPMNTIFCINHIFVAHLVSCARILAGLAGFGISALLVASNSLGPAISEGKRLPKATLF